MKKLDLEKIKEFYLNEGKSITEISKLFSYCRKTITDHLRKEGIKIIMCHPRHSGQFKKGYISQKKNKTYEEYFGVEKAKEIGLKISKTRIERGVAKGKNNPMYGKKRPDWKKLKKQKGYEEKRVNSLIKSMKIKPNKPEKVMMGIIKENNLPFNYVGDGKMWFTGNNNQHFNPDFLSKNPKHIIELFGDYWHNREDKKKRDKERLKTYSKYGYKTLIIWEHELKNPIQVVNKIGRFIR